jgi:hypothetical protein
LICVSATATGLCGDAAIETAPCTPTGSGESMEYGKRTFAVGSVTTPRDVDFV